jgi:hypothetical protein
MARRRRSALNLAPGGAWFPPLAETTVAASIVYMALENIMGIDFSRRMLITGIFGLAEIGQVLVLALMLPALMLVRRYLLPAGSG